MNATQEVRNTPDTQDDHIWIELNRQGIVAVHGEIADTPFLSLIGPAITNLDRTIQDLQAFTTSKAFARIVQEAATKMGNIAGEETDAESTATA
jgi:hypothetical protein